MIISDGTTELTFSGTQIDDFPIIEQSSSRTTGGGTRTIRAGERFSVVEKIRVTGSELRSLMDMLLNGANDYYYTPSVTPDYMSSTDFPMPVKIREPKKIRSAGGGNKKFYVELKIESADYQ